MSNRAWVTLATNDSYGLGALVLAHSLRRCGSVYPTVILITPAVTDAMRERLRAVFAEVIMVNVLDSGDAAHLALLRRPELGITFTKIHCWNLTQYEKCVFLDADTLVVQNCDELFEREELSAAPDVGWPDCFNSGVFVYQPSKQTFDALIKFAQERGSFDGGDQGLLNSFFSNWAQGDIKKHLPFLYNVTSAAFYSYLPALKHFGQDLKIIHFIGAAKPWLQTYNWESNSVDAPGHLQETLQLWWDIFVSSVHRQLDVTMVEEEIHPELPQLDQSQYYVPEVDPASEFPWHHIEEQLHRVEELPKLDLTQFFDPWELYKGSIPPKNNPNLSSIIKNQERLEVTEEYSLNYQGTQEYVPKTTYSHNIHQIHNRHHHTNHQYNHNDDHQWQEQNDISHKTSIVHQHDQTQYYNHAQNDQQKEYRHEQHYHQNNQFSQHQEKQHHYVMHVEELCNNESQVNSHNHSAHNHESHLTHTHLPIADCLSHAKVKTISKTKIKKTIPIKKRWINPIDSYCIDTLNGNTNNEEEEQGDSSDDIRPRHPYDDFYLRHRPTIDPRGKKICKHRFPPTPPPTPSPEPEPIRKLEEEELFEDALEIQSGVAGNLARVVPGAASFQRDALDELTRRQGWEAGHIDYMGADSFDNIWAKISQTLSQAPKQRTPPPKEPTPPPKQPSPTKEQAASAKTPSPPKEQLVISKQPSPPKEQPAPVKQPSPPKEQPAPVKQPSPPKEQPAPVKQPSPPKQQPAPVKQPSPPKAKQITSPIEAVLVTAPQSAEPIKEPEPVLTPVTKTLPILGAALDTAPVAPQTEQKSSPSLAQGVDAPSTPPIKTELKSEKQPSATPPATELISTPATETPSKVEAPLAAALDTAPVIPQTEQKSSPSLAKAVDPPSTPPLKTAAPLEKSLELSGTPSDSPPLANTPAKEESSPSSKAEGERARKPAGKLQLNPPVVADPLTTPDSELEDAASLAQSIIASELATPTVTSPTPPTPLTPASPPAFLKPEKRLSIEESVPDTPPAGPVSLAQIGVKPGPKAKSSIAAQIESSVGDKTVAPETPSTPSTPSQPGTPTETPKKKVVKKVVKKDAAATSGDAPVPPPRKKEKKPKDK